MRPSTKIPCIVTTAFLVLVGTQLLDAAGSTAGAKFGPKWKTLIGEWQGENQSGSGSGACGFHFDLTEHVIVRTNHAELSAAGRPHDDLMVISPEPLPDKAKAIYFDNEGHVIEYAAEWSADGNVLTLLSKPGPGPQFRLTYKKNGSEGFAVTFEIAPPGQPAAFKEYTSGKIRRIGK